MGEFVENQLLYPSSDVSDSLGVGVIPEKGDFQGSDRRSGHDSPAGRGVATGLHCHNFHLCHPPPYHPLASITNKPMGGVAGDFRGGGMAAVACWGCHVGDAMLERSYWELAR